MRALSALTQTAYTRGLERCVTLIGKMMVSFNTNCHELPINGCA